MIGMGEPKAGERGDEEECGDRWSELDATDELEDDDTACWADETADIAAASRAARRESAA